MRLNIAYSAVQSIGTYASQSLLGGDRLQMLRQMVAKQLASCKGNARCPSPAASSAEQALFYDQGPFWDRSFHHWGTGGGSVEGCAKVQEALDAVGAKQVVVGHSIQVRTTLAHLSKGLFAPCTWRSALSGQCT